MTAPANDHLFDELLRPIVDEFYETAKTLAKYPDNPDTALGRIALLTRMNTLQECGDRTAQVLGFAEPLWDDMRGLSGIPW